MNTDPITLARVVLNTHVERDWRPLDGINLGGTVCDSCRRPWPCHFTDLARAVLRMVALADELDHEASEHMDRPVHSRTGTRIRSVLTDTGKGNTP